MSGEEQPLVGMATGMLEIAQQRLAQAYPFHARFIATWHTQASTLVHTMGVTVSGGKIVLYFNPTFVVACSFPHLIGVLHHEVNHLLFGHLFMDPADFPDGPAFTVAQEVTANEWIPEPLPGTPVLLARFPQLPANEDTCTRYHRLARASGGQSTYQTGHPMDHKRPQPVPNSVSSGHKQPPSAPLSEAVATLDDHHVWAEARASGPLAQMAVRVLIRQAVEALSPAQWQHLPPALRAHLRAMGSGATAGASLEALTPGGIGDLDWRQLLRRYVRTATARRPVFTRPSRRFPTLVGIVPGHLQHSTRATIVVVIDTSASMSTALLERIAGELDRLAVGHEVVVVECDAVVQAVYPYRGRLSSVRGRGGTDLRPPFDPALLGRLHPDLLLYFTDGDGPAPALPPTVPVLWCLTPGGQRPAPWGRALRLPAG